MLALARLALLNITFFLSLTEVKQRLATLYVFDGFATRASRPEPLSALFIMGMKLKRNTVLVYSNICY